MVMSVRFVVPNLGVYQRTERATMREVKHTLYPQNGLSVKFNLENSLNSVNLGVTFKIVWSGP